MSVHIDSVESCLSKSGGIRGTFEPTEGYDELLEVAVRTAGKLATAASYVSGSALRFAATIVVT
jgi:hypothetical protein